MKVLWVTNAIVGDLANTLYIKLTSGQWLNAEIDNEKKSGENEIVVCTSSDKPYELKKDNIKYIVLAHGPVSNYSVTDEKTAEWKKFLDSEQPDVILVWGTEYAIGKCVLLANNKKIPSVIFIQGIMSAIADNYRGGLSDREIKSFTTILERIRKKSIFDLEALQYLKAKNEQETVMLSNGVIIENSYAAEEYKKISPDLRIYKSRLPIKKDFAEYTWEYDTCEKHSVVTTAANYPLKGLHKLLEAIIIVKDRYPDVKLYVPGPNSVTTQGLKACIKRSGYCKKIRKMIKQYNLSDNVCFTGPLTTHQYAERMKKSNVFVTASATENHCSALREAMSVGVPCVSSAVGGILEYAVDRENCSLYEYSDCEGLAQKISELFEDADLRQKYSKNGKATIKKMYTEDTLMSLSEIYKEIANS